MNSNELGVAVTVVHTCDDDDHDDDDDYDDDNHDDDNDYDHYLNMCRVY